MSKRLRNRARTERQILRAARTLFIAEGFESATMDAIAESADVSRATLFNYFPSKTALLIGLGGDLESRLLRALQHYRSKHEHAEDVITALFGRLSEVLDQTAPLTRLLFLHTSEQGGLPTLQAELVDLTSEAQTRGQWRDDIAVSALAELVYLAVVANLLGWKETTAGKTADSIKSRAHAVNQLLKKVA